MYLILTETTIRASEIILSALLSLLAKPTFKSFVGRLRTESFEKNLPADIVFLKAVLREVLFALITHLRKWLLYSRMGLDTLLEPSDRVGDSNDLVDIVNSTHWYTTTVTILPLIKMEAMKPSTNSYIFGPSEI